MLTKPALKIMSFNVKRDSAEQADVLSGIKADIMCLQETQRETTTPNISNMHIAANIESSMYGSTVLVREQRQLKNTAVKHQDAMEPIIAELNQTAVVSVYNPPDEQLTFPFQKSHDLS